MLLRLVDHGGQYAVSLPPLARVPRYNCPVPDLVERFGDVLAAGRTPRDALLEIASTATSWFALTELLMVFAHRYSHERAAFVQTDGSIFRRELGSTSARPRARALLDAHPRPDWLRPADPGTVTALAELLGDAAPDTSAMATATLEVAQVLAEYQGEEFENHFWESPRALRYERAYPPSLRNPYRSMGGGFLFNTEPTKLPPGFGHVRGLRLAGEASKWFNISVTSWTGESDPLSALGVSRPLVIATCHPNYAVEEFRYSYTVNPMVLGSPDPINRPRQRWLLRRQVDAAVAAGATVVVIPEFVVHAEDRDDLRNYLDGLEARRPLLVVAGTNRIADESGDAGNESSGWVNRVVVWADGATWTQDKMYPARIGLRVPEFSRPQRFEEVVTPGQVVQVFRTPRWVVAVLICRDAMSRELLDQLADLGVNLCIVPGCSPHWSSIISSLASLRTRSQAFTVVANSPGLWEGIPALDASFDGPFEHPPGPAARLSSDRAPGPGIWVWSPTPGDSSPVWHPTVTANRSPEEWLQEFTRLVNAPALGADLHQIVANALAIHGYPATWRLADGTFATGDAAATAFEDWLNRQPTFEPRSLRIARQGLVAVATFEWTDVATGGDHTWTAVLTEQPDHHWLTLFHEPGQHSARFSVPRGTGTQLPSSPHAWEAEFVHLVNEPRKRMPNGELDAVDPRIVEASVSRLLRLYAAGAVYLHRPGRAIVAQPDDSDLARGLRALLVRGPRFTLEPGRVHHYGAVAVQTCRWWLTDMGEFPDESGHSTVVLVAQPEGGWRCIFDDPWSALSGPLQIDASSRNESSSREPGVLPRQVGDPSASRTEA